MTSNLDCVGIRGPPFPQHLFPPYSPYAPINKPVIKPTPEPPLYNTERVGWG